jgi:hypothetical protein
MAKAGKILIAIGITLWACSTTYNEVAPDTELIVTVENETGQLLDVVDVYVFESHAAFTQTAGSGVPAGFLITGKTKQGVVTLTNLPFDQGLYIYATWQDTAVFPGTYVTFDNSDQSYSLKNPLTRGSVTSLHIVVKPADGFITFWTSVADSSSLPINVFLGGVSGGTLNHSSASPPTHFQSQGLTVRARKGNVNIEGKSPSGCLWADTVTAIAGQNIIYQFTNCTVGTIAFYTDNSNATKLPISVTLNSNDVIGDVIAPVTTTPADCSAINLATAFRVPGDYTYEAKSANGNCLWTGTFTLVTNNCTIIQLSTCN